MDTHTKEKFTRATRKLKVAVRMGMMTKNGKTQTLKLEEEFKRRKAEAIFNLLQEKRRLYKEQHRLQIQQHANQIKNKLRKQQENHELIVLRQKEDLEKSLSQRKKKLPVFLDQLKELPNILSEDTGSWKTPWYREIVNEYRHSRILHQDIKKFEFNVKTLRKLAPNIEADTKAELEARELERRKKLFARPLRKSPTAESAEEDTGLGCSTEFKGVQLSPEKKKELRRKKAARGFLDRPKRGEKSFAASILPMLTSLERKITPTETALSTWNQDNKHRGFLVSEKKKRLHFEERVIKESLSRHKETTRQFLRNKKLGPYLTGKVLDFANDFDAEYDEELEDELYDADEGLYDDSVYSNGDSLASSPRRSPQSRNIGSADSELEDSSLSINLRTSAHLTVHKNFNNLIDINCSNADSINDSNTTSESSLAESMEPKSISNGNLSSDQFTSRSFVDFADEKSIRSSSEQVSTDPYFSFGDDESKPELCPPRISRIYQNINDEDVSSDPGRQPNITEESRENLPKSAKSVSFRKNPSIPSTARKVKSILQNGKKTPPSATSKKPIPLTMDDMLGDDSTHVGVKYGDVKPVLEKWPVMFRTYLS